MDATKQCPVELYLGLDIGGTKCSVVLADSSFSIKQKVVFDTLTERGYQAILSEFMVHIDSILTGYSDNELKGIGISCGGPLDSVKGIIYSPPNLPGWDSVPIVDIFKKNMALKHPFRMTRMHAHWQNG